MAVRAAVARAAAETAAEEREGVQVAAKAVEGREGVGEEGVHLEQEVKGVAMLEAVSIRSKKRRFHQV